MNRRLLVAVAALLAAATLVTAQTPDIVGDWDATIQTPQGDRPVKVSLTRDGEKLTGTLGGPQGDLPVEGTFKDNALSLAFSVQTQNGSLVIMMNGTLEGNAIKGTITFGGMGQGNWSATRAGVATDGGAAQAKSDAAVDVSGNWVFTVETDAGSGNPTFVFKQEGDKLTGTYSGLLGQANLTGTVKGRAIEFSFEGDAQGQKMTVTYKGTVENKDAMKGTVNLGDLGEGSFTGKRQ